MKNTLIALAVTSTLFAASAAAAAPQMDPNMPGMAGMQQDAKPEAHGVGVVKAIDTAKGTITLQHDAIMPIGWPAMTMAFNVATPALLKVAKVGDKVTFTLHPAGIASVVTSITLMQP
jgi:Cu(I)/Ag(I) efflux system protein CusF